MAHSSKSPDSLENLTLELRRGCLPLAVLIALRTEQYGSSLRKLLARSKLKIDESTLYPLLRRLESQGMLTSEWREHDNRKKRFYKLSEYGKGVQFLLTCEWEQMNAAVQKVLTRSDAALANPQPSTDTPPDSAKDDSDGTH